MNDYEKGFADGFKCMTELIAKLLGKKPMYLPEDEKNAVMFLEILDRIEMERIKTPSDEKMARALDIRRKWDAAKICPHCGIREGFAPGTGDCGCEVDPE